MERRKRLVQQDRSNITRRLERERELYSIYNKSITPAISIRHYSNSLNVYHHGGRGEGNTFRAPRPEFEYNQGQFQCIMLNADGDAVS